MAGYSGTPLLKKLGIKEGHLVSIVKESSGLPEELQGVETDELPSQPEADVILLFVTQAADYEAKYERVKSALKPNGGLWVCWPKKASKVPTDVTEDVIRDYALTNGLVDNKVCAVDEVWSGLRLVYRLVDRKQLRKKKLKKKREKLYNAQSV